MWLYFHSVMFRNFISIQLQYHMSPSGIWQTHRNLKHVRHAQAPPSIPNLMKRSTTCSTPYEITSEGNDVVVDIVYVKKKIPTSAMCYPYSTQSMKTESKLFVRKSQSLTLPPIPYANLHLCSDLVFFSCLVCLYFFLLLHTPNEYRRKGANRFRAKCTCPTLVLHYPCCIRRTIFFLLLL